MQLGGVGTVFAVGVDHLVTVQTGEHAIKACFFYQLLHEGDSVLQHRVTHAHKVVQRDDAGS